MSKVDDQINDFEGEAIERLEAFINSMMGDDRFVIPVDEYDDGPVEEGWTHVYTA